MLPAGIGIGQTGIGISDEAKSIFFILFMVAESFGVGPQVVRGIAIDGAQIAGITVGWLLAEKPQIGNVPRPTLWFMTSVGPNFFVAISVKVPARILGAGARPHVGWRRMGRS